MSRLPIAIALLAAAVAAPALAASPFDGTWKADLKASKPSDKPRSTVIKDGVFKCDCTPPVEIKADGQFHKIMGNPYADEQSVKIVSPREVTVSQRKDGKLIGTSTTKLSADGNMKTSSYTDMSAPNGVVVKGTTSSKRVGPAPAGAHPLSGAWAKLSDDSMSAAGMTETVMVKGKSVAISTPTGISYDAPLDGTPAKINGDPAGAMASMKMTGPRTLVETDTIAGKPETITTFTVRPDGKTADLSVDYVRPGRTDMMILRKQ